jgi:hypothetical protein
LTLDAKSSGYMQLVLPETDLAEGTKWSIDEITSGLTLGPSQSDPVKVSVEFVVKGFREIDGTREVNILAMKEGKYDVEGDGIRVRITLVESRDYWVRVKDGVLRSLHKRQIQILAGDFDAVSEVIETATLIEAKS